MPTRNLPHPPNLDHLKKQAKALLKQVRADDPDALALAREFHPMSAPTNAQPVNTLADAQLVIARGYGFASWPRLVRHLAVVEQYSRSPHRQQLGGPLDTPVSASTSFSASPPCTTARTTRPARNPPANSSTKLP